VSPQSASRVACLLSCGLTLDWVQNSSLIYAGSTTSSCSPIKLGYDFEPTLLGVDVLKGTKARKVLPALTGALVRPLRSCLSHHPSCCSADQSVSYCTVFQVLVVVSCGLTFFALVTSLLSVFCNSRFWEIMSFLWCIVAALITWVSRLHCLNLYRTHSCSPHHSDPTRRSRSSSTSSSSPSVASALHRTPTTRSPHRTDRRCGSS
jgi:hypothetical protein